MRFEKVNNPQGLKFICCKCFKTLSLEVYADLDGKAFEAYYCKECMKESNNIKKEVIRDERQGS